MKRVVVNLVVFAFIVGFCGGFGWVLGTFAVQMGNR